MFEFSAKQAQEMSDKASKEKSYIKSSIIPEAKFLASKFRPGMVLRNIAPGLNFRNVVQELKNMGFNVIIDNDICYIDWASLVEGEKDVQFDYIQKDFQKTEKIVIDAITKKIKNSCQNGEREAFFYHDIELTKRILNSLKEKGFGVSRTNIKNEFRDSKVKKSDLYTCTTWRISW